MHPENENSPGRQLKQLDLAEAAVQAVVANPDLALRCRDRQIELAKIAKTRLHSTLRLTDEKYKIYFLKQVCTYYLEERIPEMRKYMAERHILSASDEEALRRSAEEDLLLLEQQAAEEHGA